MLVARRLIASSHIFVDFRLGTIWLLLVLLLTFAAFWCAFAANGTVRAVIWAVPVLLILGLANQFGDWAGRELTGLVISRFNLLADFKFTNAVVSRFHNSGFLQFVVWGGGYYFQYITPMLVFILVPTLLLAVIQSFRLFRAQLQGSTLSVLRNLWPLAMLVFLCSFPLSAVSTFVYHALNEVWRAEFETLRAIEKIHPDAAKLDAAHPLRLTVDDLARVSPLSEQTRRWLGNSPVTIAPHKMPLGLNWWGGNLKSSPPAFLQDYLVTVHFAGSSVCDQHFWYVPYPKRDVRMLVVICK
jgi:fumarate reductase subunit D